MYPLPTSCAADAYSAAQRQGLTTRAPILRYATKDFAGDAFCCATIAIRLPITERLSGSVAAAECGELLVAKFGVKRFLLFDDLLDVSSSRMEEICRGMMARFPDIEWVACARADGVSKESISMMKRAGCVELAMGIESGAPSVLESYSYAKWRL